MGARDKHRRFRMEGDRSWPCEKNLGDYAIYGGPGRPKGRRNRSREDRLIEADAVIREFMAHNTLSTSAMLKAAKAMRVLAKLR